MARIQLNLVLGALSIFVSAFFIGFNLSARMSIAPLISATDTTFKKALQHSPPTAHHEPTSDQAPTEHHAKHAPVVSATDTALKTEDCITSAAMSGRKPTVPNDGEFQLHGSECLGSSVKLMPSARVSKECAWILDLDALPGLGFSAHHQDQIIENIFNRIGRTNKFFVEFGFGYAYLSDSKDSYLGVKLNSKHLRFFNLLWLICQNHVPTVTFPFSFGSRLHEARGWLERSLF
jgi:hypothetical protein